TIPFSLLFAATCLDLRHIPANLLSLGALDFGMVVDGAVVMVENIVRHLSHQDAADTRAPMEKIRSAAHEVQRPVFYAIGIIITAYIPMFSMLLAPVLASLFFPKGTREWHNPLMSFLTARYRWALGLAIRWRWATLGIALTAFGFSMYL